MAIGTRANPRWARPRSIASRTSRFSPCRWAGKRRCPALFLDTVSAPSYGLLGEEIAVPFKVISHLPREVKTTVTISDNFGESARKDITIPAKGEVEDAILWSPRAGRRGHRHRQIAGAAGRGHRGEQPAHAFICPCGWRRLKVLVVDSLPRWEYRYLRNALARDPGVDMQLLVVAAGPGTGRRPRLHFPRFPTPKRRWRLTTWFSWATSAWARAN